MSFPANLTPWRLEWTEELSVGIPEVDVEHQHFIRLINELNEAIRRRLDVAHVQERLQAILDDAATHFGHEEKLFREWGYPEAEDHADKHAQVTSALQKIMARFEPGGTEREWIEAGLEVKKTLIDHLLVEDMKYRDYRRKNNLGTSRY